MRLPSALQRFMIVQGGEAQYIRSLAMISTRSFCQTPTQLKELISRKYGENAEGALTSRWYQDRCQRRRRTLHPFLREEGAREGKGKREDGGGRG